MYKREDNENGSGDNLLFTYNTGWFIIRCLIMFLQFFSFHSLPLKVKMKCYVISSNLIYKLVNKVI